MMNARIRRGGRFLVGCSKKLMRRARPINGGGRKHVTTLGQWICVSLFASLANGMPAQAQGEREREGTEQPTRIVDGEEVRPGSWPWQVSITLADTGHWCGGSVIAPRWVLTAAHCVFDRSGLVRHPGDLSVLAGTHDLDEGGIHVDVKRVVVHHGYSDGAFEDDIALLELTGPAGVRSVELPDEERAEQFSSPGTMATVTGWGFLKPKDFGPKPTADAPGSRIDDKNNAQHVEESTGQRGNIDDGLPTRLMQVELPLVDEKTCREAYPPPQFAIDARTLCAGYVEGEKDSCSGDSGGPLVVRASDGWMQLGIVSWGWGCATPGNFGVYTRVSKYQDWVAQQTGLGLSAAYEESSATLPQTPEPSTSSQASVRTRGDRALVIGIDRYANPRFNLAGAVNDAKNMHRLLIEHAGFDADEVLVLTDELATRNEILNAIHEWLVEGTRANSRAVLYFAGHGYRQKDDDGDETDGLDEVLVPHDSRLISADSEPMQVSNLISDDEIRTLFDGLRDRHAFVIVDACHSGTITRALTRPDPSFVRTIDLRLRDETTAPIRRSRSRGEGLDPRPEGFISSSDNLVAWTAVSSSQLALEDRDASPRQGVFTRHFVQGLAERRADRNGDGRVSHSEMLDFVRGKSAEYCARYAADCDRGLTPLLEGPPDVLHRDVLAIGTPTPQDVNTVAEYALENENRAEVRLDILPSTSVRVGDVIRFLVRSERTGHLLLVDVPENGKVTQLFPNDHSVAAGRGGTIDAGQTIELNEYLGFTLRAQPPTGAGSLYAVVTEDPVALSDLTESNRDLRPVADPQGWLLALGERLREPWQGESEVRAARWSATSVDYEIVP